MADDPLLYVERQAYLANLGGMVGRVEAARVALVKARHRLDGETGRRGGTIGIQEGRIQWGLTTIRGGLDGSAQQQGTMPSARPIRSGMRMVVRNLIPYSTLRFAK